MASSIASQMESELSIQKNSQDVLNSTKDKETILVKSTKDIAEYASIDVKDQEKHFDDIVEDLLIRIDEFEHLLELCKSDTNACLFKQIPQWAEKFKDMQKVFEKIDKLEYMVAKVKNDMDNMEKHLIEAESTVESTTGTLSSFMPRIFGGKFTQETEETTECPSFKIFNTEEFFPPSSSSSS